MYAPARYQSLELLLLCDLNLAALLLCLERVGVYLEAEASGDIVCCIERRAHLWVDSKEHVRKRRAEVSPVYVLMA